MPQRAPICEHRVVSTAHASVRAIVRFVALAAACGSAVWMVGCFAPALALPVVLAFALAFAAVTLQILALAAQAPGLRWGQAALAAALCVAALAGLAAAPATARNAALLSFALGAGAALVGAAFGCRIERPGQLAAVALVSALADLWSVFDPAAPSAALAEQALARPEQLAVFALPFPLLGTPLVPAIIGAGDLVFAALYVAAFRAHALPLPRVLLALALAFAVGLAGLLITLRPLPLLPLLGAAVVACHPAARSLSRREWRTVLLVTGLLCAAIALRVLTRA